MRYVLCAIMLALVGALVLAGCKGSEEQTTSGPTTPPAATKSAAVPAPATPVTGDITVFVPCGMQGPLVKAFELFQEQNPGVKFHRQILNIDVILEEILTKGTPADCMISIGDVETKLLQDEGKVDGDVVKLAENGLAITVPLGNPAGVKSVEDLTKDTVKTVGLVDSTRMSVGYYGEQALKNAGVFDKIAGKLYRPKAPAEIKAQCAQKKIEAGIGYATCMVEAKAPGGEPVVAEKSEGVCEVPHDLYDRFYATAVVLKGAGNPEAARAFITFLATNPEVQKMLVSYGLKPLGGA